MGNQICDRCGANTIMTTMSYFNTEMVCPDCEKAEREHPKYAEAVAREHEEVKRGNYNFQGIGLPEDLRRAKKC